MRGKKVIAKCKFCECEFETLLSKIKLGKGIFCSKECYYKYLRRNTNGYLLDKKGYNVFYQKKNKYNLNKEEYLKLYTDQNNKCKICGESFDNIKACVDHSHTTGLVRGLLCSKCNKGLGFFNDNIEILKKAIDYLQ